jgi:hypothetical protein
MDADELLIKAREALDERVRKRAEMRKRLDRAERELLRARRELMVLEGMAERYGFGENPDDAAPPATSDWVHMNRQEAALRGLKDLGRPASLKEIQGQLRSVGRDDDELPLISAALAALRKKGEVQPRDRGVWEIVTKHETVMDIPRSLRPLPGFRVAPTTKETG